MRVMLLNLDVICLNSGDFPFVQYCRMLLRISFVAMLMFEMKILPLMMMMMPVMVNEHQPVLERTLIEKKRLHNDQISQSYLQLMAWGGIDVSLELI